MPYHPFLSIRALYSFPVRNAIGLSAAIYLTLIIELTFIYISICLHHENLIICFILTDLIIPISFAIASAVCPKRQKKHPLGCFFSILQYRRRAVVLGLCDAFYYRLIAVAVINVHHDMIAGLFAEHCLSEGRFAAYKPL